MTKTDYPAPINVLDSITQLVAFGNSIMATGAGSSDTTRDLMTRLAQMIGCREVNCSIGGAAAAWNMDITNGEFGLWPQIYQNHKRPVRPASTLNADPADNATSLTLAHSNTSATGIPFTIDKLIHVGTGDPGATGGEIMGATANQSGTTLAVAGTETWELETGASTGAERDHANGDPVYEVPTQYTAGNTIYLINESYNHLGHLGITADSEKWFKAALRSSLSRLRCAEVYEPDHTALKFTGTWDAIIASPSSSSGQGTGGQRVGAGLKRAGAVSAAVEFHLPNNFPGGSVVLAFVGAANTAGTGVWSFTVDGSSTMPDGSANTLTPPRSIGTSDSIRAHNITYCKRFTKLSAGRHKIVATMSTFETGNYFDWAGIEAPEPPVIVVMKPHRLYDYTLFGSGWVFGHIPMKMNLQANAGASSIRVPQTWKTTARQLAATPNAISTQGPHAGELIWINPGTATEEQHQVSSVTFSSPNYTINLVGTLANTQPVDTIVHAGICDAALGIKGESGRMCAWIDSVCDEFEPNSGIVRYNPDKVTHARTAPNKDREMFWPRDLCHGNDLWHAAISEDLYKVLARSPAISPRRTSRLAKTSRQGSLVCDFLATGNSTTNPHGGILWTNVPAGQTEIFGSTFFRAVRDLQTYQEFRVGCVLPLYSATGAADIKLRLEFSLDSGTTWFSMGRAIQASLPDRPERSDYTALTTYSQTGSGDCSTGTTAGLKMSRWAPIYPDAQAESVYLRITTVSAAATADPTFLSIWAEFR